MINKRKNMITENFKERINYLKKNKLIVEALYEILDLFGGKENFIFCHNTKNELLNEKYTLE